MELELYYEYFVFTVKQVFSEQDFLGWYTTGDGTTDADIKIHKQVYIYFYGL